MLKIKLILKQTRKMKLSSFLSRETKNIPWLKWKKTKQYAVLEIGDRLLGADMTYKLGTKLINLAIQSVTFLEVSYVIKNQQHKNILQEVKINNLKFWNGKFIKWLKKLKIMTLRILNLLEDIKVFFKQ